MKLIDGKAVAAEVEVETKARIEALTRDLEAITARLADAEAARDQATATAATAGAEAEVARQAAHTAELRAADATATARTLRDIIDTLKTTTHDPAGLTREKASGSRSHL